MAPKESQKSPQGSTIFHKVPSVSMRFHRVRGSEGLSAFLRFSRVLSGSPRFFEVSSGVLPRFLTIPEGSLRFCKGLKGSQWSTLVELGSLRFARRRNAGVLYVAMNKSTRLQGSFFEVLRVSQEGVSRSLIFIQVR